MAPVISYKYGSRDKDQLHKIVSDSIGLLGVCSVLSFALSWLVSTPVITVFTSRESVIFQITNEGIKLYSICFILMGINIFVSALFTALSDGKSSAIISFSRTFLFLVTMILLLPAVIGDLGVWLSVPCAEALGMLLSVRYLIAYRRKFWR